MHAVRGDSLREAASIVVLLITYCGGIMAYYAADESSARTFVTLVSLVGNILVVAVLVWETTPENVKKSILSWSCVCMHQPPNEIKPCGSDVEVLQQDSRAPLLASREAGL